MRKKSQSLLLVGAAVMSLLTGCNKQEKKSPYVQASIITEIESMGINPETNNTNKIEIAVNEAIDSILSYRENRDVLIGISDFEAKEKLAKIYGNYGSFEQYTSAIQTRAEEILKDQIRAYRGKPFGRKVDIINLTYATKTENVQSPYVWRITYKKTYDGKNTIHEDPIEFSIGQDNQALIKMQELATAIENFITNKDTETYRNLIELIMKEYSEYLTEYEEKKLTKLYQNEELAPKLRQ